MEVRGEERGSEKRVEGDGVNSIGKNIAEDRGAGGQVRIIRRCALPPLWMNIRSFNKNLFKKEKRERFMLTEPGENVESWKQ